MHYTDKELAEITERHAILACYYNLIKAWVRTHPIK